MIMVVNWVMIMMFMIWKMILMRLQRERDMHTFAYM